MASQAGWTSLIAFVMPHLSMTQGVACWVIFGRFCLLHRHLRSSTSQLLYLSVASRMQPTAQPGTRMPSTMMSCWGFGAAEAMLARAARAKVKIFWMATILFIGTGVAEYCLLRMRDEDD